MAFPAGFDVFLNDASHTDQILLVVSPIARRTPRIQELEKCDNLGIVYIISRIVRNK
jgi:hypothetical protein